MPGAKICSRYSEGKLVSADDSMFAVAKIKSIQSALGVKTKSSKSPETVHNNNCNNFETSNRKLANQKAIYKIRKRTSPLEGEHS